MDYSLPGSSVHEILQARILVWVAMPSARRSSDPGIEPGSPSLKEDSLPSEPPGKPSMGTANVNMPKKIILTSKNILKAVEVLKMNASSLRHILKSICLHLVSKYK